MKTELNLPRRNFLRIGVAGAVSGLVLQHAKAAELCAQTVAQPEGPFYPGDANILPINDLTRVAGSTTPALGEVIYVRGVVRDADCRPVEGVNVEIWQACASGKYNHAGDPNPAPLDPNFRYWGEAFTNALGEYEFKTIKPGAYPASSEWDRPPHIHFRLAKRGYVELITQMYFAGEPLNSEDLILQRVPERFRDTVVVDFSPSLTQPGAQVGIFDISIEKIV